MDKPKEIRNMAALCALLSGDEKNFAVAQMPGGIEAQEAAGQRLFIERQMLPQEGTIKPGFYGSEGQTNRAKLEAIGFAFGEPVDELFVTCQLPQGWKKEATDHSMWSRLVDGQGRTRAHIFYKAAFYDRSAHLDLEARFSLRTWYAATPAEAENLKGTPEQVCVVASDAGTPIWHSAPRTYADWEGKEQQQKQARAWLDEHYPEWRNPFAYWEEAKESAGSQPTL